MDLGFPQYAVNRPQHKLSDKRDNTALARLGRCARLTVFLRGRQYLVAAAGVCPAAYGAGQNQISDERVLGLRRANLKALWRTYFRTAPELVFCQLGLPWRADILACSVVGPWWFLWAGAASGACCAGNSAAYHTGNA